MPLLLENERLHVAKTALALLQTGLVVNTSGNVSMRIDDKIVVTPSGCAYEKLTARDIVVLDLAGEQIEGDLLPSSETPLHLAVYASNEQTRAIVHTHSVYATAVSTLVTELPAIHYQIADLGGPVPVAPYQTFGTAELAASVNATLTGRTAALMQNHGAITIAGTLPQALARSVTLEWLSRVYLIATQSGSPSLIDDAELDRVRKQQNRFGSEQERRLHARDATVCCDKGESNQSGQ